MKSSRDIESSGEEGRSLTRVPTATYVDVRAVAHQREELTRVPTATYVHVKSLATVDPMDDLVLQLERVETARR